MLDSIAYSKKKIEKDVFQSLEDHKPKHVGFKIKLFLILFVCRKITSTMLSCCNSISMLPPTENQKCSNPVTGSFKWV